MGWASGGDIFDPIAKALVDLNADESTKRAILGPLIGRLQDEDWDTEDASIEEFRDDPIIVSLLMEHGVNCSLSGGGYGRIEHHAGGWTLECETCGRVLDTATGTDGHDRLVRVWADHDGTEHGGDGEVPEWALIVQPSADGGLFPEPERSKPKRSGLAPVAAIHAMTDIEELRNVAIALAAERERLKVAIYWTGPEECVGERECDEYFTEDGDDRPEVELCSHVEEAVATADDAIRLHRIRDQLKRIDPERENAEELRHQLDMVKRYANDDLD